MTRARLRDPQMTAYLATARWFGGKGRDLRRGRRPARRRLAARVRPTGDASSSSPSRYADGRASTRDLPDAALATTPRSRSGIEHALVGACDRRRPRRRARLRRRARPGGDGASTSTPSTATAGDSTREYGELTFHRLGRPRPRPRGALDAVLRRAEQLLGGVRRGQPDEGVPQGRPRAATPTSRSTRRSPSAEQRPRRRALRLARARRDGADEPSSWRCSSSSCAPPATAGTSRWPACATCSPRPTCTPTRSAATSPARPSGSALAVAAGARRPAPSTFPTEHWVADDLAALSDAMLTRLEARWRVVPELEPHADGAARDLRRGVARRSASRDAPSGCTATSTSARPCAPSRAGRSSTSRASPPSRSPSGCCPTSSGATSPACCARSTTPRTRSRRTSQADRGASRADRVPRRRVGRPQPRRRSCAATSTTAAAPDGGSRRAGR